MMLHDGSCAFPVFDSSAASATSAPGASFASTASIRRFSVLAVLVGSGSRVVGFIARLNGVSIFVILFAVISTSAAATTSAGPLLAILEVALGSATASGSGFSCLLVQVIKDYGAFSSCGLRVSSVS